MLLFVPLVVRDGKTDFSPVFMIPATVVPPPVVRVTVAAASFVSLSYTEALKEDSPSSSHIDCLGVSAQEGTGNNRTYASFANISNIPHAYLYSFRLWVGTPATIASLSRKKRDPVQGGWDLQCQTA